MSNDNIFKEMGSKVRAARLDKKMSLDKLSELTGINVSILLDIEDGKQDTKILTLKRIADVLEKDVKDFI